MAVGWHVRALAIRLGLGVPQAWNDLGRLASLRRELGPHRFTALLAEATDDTELAGAPPGLLDQADAAGSDG